MDVFVISCVVHCLLHLKSILYEGAVKKSRCPQVVLQIYQLSHEQEIMEMPGIEPGASYMQSMRSTTELQPHDGECSNVSNKNIGSFYLDLKQDLDPDVI